MNWQPMPSTNRAHRNNFWLPHTLTIISLRDYINWVHKIPCHACIWHNSHNTPSSFNTSPLLFRLHRLLLILLHLSMLALPGWRPIKGAEIMTWSGVWSHHVREIIDSNNKWALERWKKSKTPLHLIIWIIIGQSIRLFVKIYRDLLAKFGTSSISSMWLWYLGKGGVQMEWCKAANCEQLLHIFEDKKKRIFLVTRKLLRVGL